MIDGGDGKNNVKIIAWTIKFLDCGRQDPGLRQLELFHHGAKCLMALAGVIGTFGQWLQADDVAGAMHCRPQAEHAFAAADLQHSLVAEIDFVEELAGKSWKIEAMVPQSHFLAHQPDALSSGDLTDWNNLIRG